MIAQVLDDTLNLSKEKLISMYLISTSLWFIKRRDRFFVLNWIWTERKVPIFQSIASATHSTKGFRFQKMKRDFKKKKCLKALLDVSSSLKIEILPSFAVQKNEKNLVLRLGQPS